MKKWQIQEAKAKLSEVVQRAVNEGPQAISVRGKATAVILSEKQYNALIAPKNTFIQFLKNSPLYGLELDIERDKTFCREMKL